MPNMPNVDDFIGGDSDYLKAADLGDDEWEMIVSDVTEAEFDDHKGGKVSKLIVHFKGTAKALVSNATNNKALKAAYGNCDGWIGNKVILFTIDTQLPSGEPTKGIRVKKPAQRKVVRGSENPAHGVDDEAPF